MLLVVREGGGSGVASNVASLTRPHPLTSPPGAQCPGPTTLESLVIENKHWRYGSASATVLPCGQEYPQACTGGNADNAANETFGDHLCAEGSTGVLCR